MRLFVVLVWFGLYEVKWCVVFFSPFLFLLLLLAVYFFFEFRFLGVYLNECAGCLLAVRGGYWEKENLDGENKGFVVYRLFPCMSRSLVERALQW